MIKKTESRIAVFDSGIGGLSVLSELQKIIPKVEYYYCQDNAFHPYGTKTDEELLQRLSKLLPLLIKNCEAKILVLACNTASTIALEMAREQLRIPVVGAVPAVKPAALLSKTKVIGLLATEATVRRPYTEKLIRDFASDCEFVKVGSRKLVELAEAKLRGEKVSLSEIEDELAPFFQNEKVDTIILACTHFDHLREEFEKLAPRSIHWLSSAGAVALRTKALADDLHLGEETRCQNCLISTKFTHFEKNLLTQYGFSSYETLLLN